MRLVMVLTLGAVVTASATLPAQAPATAAQAPAAAAAPAGSAENGKKLWYDRACWQCHGLAGHGGLDAGPRLAGRVPAWPRFNTYIRKPSDQMIPYTKKVLPDQEAADIYAWLKSIPPPPDVSSIPALKQ